MIKITVKKKIDMDRFNRAWRILAELGRVDEIGSAEYHRALTAAKKVRP